MDPEEAQRGLVDDACRIAPVQLALTNAAASASYLKLDDREENAVVRVALSFAALQLSDSCSGVLIAPRLVLTAKHCLHDTSPSAITVLIVRDGATPLYRADAISVEQHPSLDLILLEIDAVPENVALPLQLAKDSSGLHQDALVQVAGFGVDAKGRSDARGFLVAHVVALTDESVTVSADGLAGSCGGDSGGPLLTRAVDGTVRIEGALSEGSADCYGRDSYVRVTAARAWIEQHFAWTSEGPAAELGDRLGAEGRCFDRTAVWRQEERVRAQTCEGELSCGWSATARGFRCVARESDPCMGISDVGKCESAAAVRCVEGRVAQWDCHACSAECARSPRTGVAVCVARKHTP